MVILNWHGRSDTVDCVESLIDGSPEAVVLVVDNGSFDGALEAVVAQWPQVRGLQLDRNYGFSGGMNRGLRHAIDELSASVVTILNNDTVVPAGAIVELGRLAASGDFAVSPEVRYREEPDKLWFGGGSLDVENGYPFHTAPNDLSQCADGLRSSMVLAGCCITARSDVWNSVGLFDERFFLNFEDSEWSLRAAKRNVRLVVACDVSILHAVSASFTGSAATLGSFYFLRNGLLFGRLAGAGLCGRMRFIRRFGLTGLRHLRISTLSRKLLVLLWAIVADATRRYGEAPPALQRRVALWNQETA